MTVRARVARGKRKEIKGMKRMLKLSLSLTLGCMLTACSAAHTAADRPDETSAPAVAQEVTAIPVVTPEPTAEPEASYEEYDACKTAAIKALQSRLLQYREDVYVYSDYAETQNNFTQKAKIWGNNASLVKNLDENWNDDAYAGASCIRCRIDTSGSDWGGWMFLNGYLPQGETQPRLNDGEQENAGLDLSGAEELRFFAKGENGGETVEFFTLGFGYDGEWGTQLVTYPGSSKKKTLGFVTLTNQWSEYVIPLGTRDLSYVCCGFGFVCSGTQSDNTENVFYLDEIRFTGEIASAMEAPVLMASYDTENQYIQNAAFSYDNALAAMAFLSEGMRDEAAQILDAFVYAVKNDRQGVPRARNAYAAGNISAIPGWESGARLPGWYDANQGEWFEDRYQVGSNVGNTSYVALALLQYCRAEANDTYLNTAAVLMDWVIENCSDGTSGFTAGFDGWAEGESPQAYPHTYKSIEHNIDAYAAFAELYRQTGEANYEAAANSALAFVESMYDEDEGVFYTGTTDDGLTPSRENIVLDAQVWTALALGEAFTPYEATLSRVEEMRVRGGGYPFCQSNENGGWWTEGTAFTALLYRLREEDAAAKAALDELASIQLDSGLFPSATVDDLATGFELFTGDPWVYTTDAHIASTAWAILALNMFNPYWFG
jgi:hypothetical protein